MPPQVDGDVRALIRRFVAERRELGDDLWPQPEAGVAQLVPETPNHETTTSPAHSDGRQLTMPTKSTPPSGGERGISVPPPQMSLLNGVLGAEQWEGLSLDEFNRTICTCTRCPLGKTRTNFVFGEGNPKADLVFVGEAPGADEDQQGRPFVGRAGQLLTKMIVAMKLKREDVYICNVLKCRPPDNRTPLPSEMETCLPYLEHQLELIEPKLICALGRVAAQVLLRTSEGLGRMRGKWHDYRGIRCMVTYHPAALLRNPGWKRESWDDLKKLRLELDGTAL